MVSKRSRSRRRRRQPQPAALDAYQSFSRPMSSRAESAVEGDCESITAGKNGC